MPTGTRSPLDIRHKPGGLYVVVDEEKCPGTIFFVDSSTGSDTANDGSAPDKALATVGAAIALCTASKGDKIVCLPGHAESIADATTIDLSVAGVELIGLGQGNARPTFTLGTATSATIAVTAANCRIANIKIVSDLADVAAGITASAAADGLTVEDCYFSDGAAAKELVIGISLAAACDQCLIRNNHFYTVAGGGCASAIKMVGESARTRIHDNYVYGDYSVAGIDGSTAAATLLDIHGNRVINLDSTAGLAISLHSSTTAVIADNRLAGAKTNTVPLVAAAAYAFENYTTAAAGESGIIKPDAETYA